MDLKHRMLLFLLHSNFPIVLAVMWVFQVRYFGIQVDSLCTSVSQTWSVLLLLLGKEKSTYSHITLKMWYNSYTQKLCVIFHIPLTMNMASYPFRIMEESVFIPKKEDLSTSDHCYSSL